MVALWCEGTDLFPGRDNTELQGKQADILQEVIGIEDRLNVGGNFGQDGQCLMLCRGQIR